MNKTLRGKTVLARVNADGEMITNGGGRVDVIYKKAPGAKVYSASARNLDPAESTDIVDFDASPPAGGEAHATKDAIIIYTDGACSGNPGPMGIGAVVINNGVRNEISEFLGNGTNNIAELTAILRALESLDEEARTRQVLVHTDSSYSIGLLTKNWKAKANKELVESLRELAKKFPKLCLVKVKGHAGIPENERADQLAVDGARGAS